MRRVLPVAVVVAALLLAIVAYRQFFPSKDATGAGGPGGPGGGMPPSQVETVAVKSQLLPSSFETVGTLRASQSVSLRPEVSGKVEAIGFTEGQPVAAGQVLFRLDDALVRADLNEAAANLQNSQRGYARARELADKQLIARSDLDKAQAALGVDQARLASARTRVDKAVIRAPFGGVAGLRQVNVGDYVDAGQDLVDLVRLDPLELDLRAPEVVLSSLAVGQQVDFGVDSFRDETFHAAVVAIAPTVDAGGRSVSLRARLDNPDRRLRPGMSARVRIVLATNTKALLVPEQAIVPMGEQKNVYVVVDGKAKLVPVTLGVRQPGYVEVTTGLKAGDQVIVSGLQKVGDGAPVAAKPAAPAAPATPARDAAGSAKP
jgi:membrane fusion protein (multidrug efflux system)